MNWFQDIILLLGKVRSQSLKNMKSRKKRRRKREFDRFEEISKQN